MKAWRIIPWALVTAALMAVSSGVTGWALRNSRASEIPASMLKSPQFHRFVDTYQLIRSESIWHNSASRLLLGATNGMVGSLHDHFSNYLTRRESHSLSSELSPSYTGIGIDVTLTKPPVIDGVFTGSPAQKAGLKDRDVIESIDGRATNAMAPSAALSLIRGRVGTTVTLLIKNGTKTRRMTLTRGTIALPTVFIRMLPGQVAYMNIQEFGQHTGSQVAAAFKRLMARHPAGIILDLRDNPGGEVSQALDTADWFVPKGPVVTLKYKDQQKNVTYDSRGPGTKLPVVVLVNQNTASAAEILSAAIQERQGGKLVGTRTYGKGIVQEVVPLSGGASLKLTVARYYTPDGQYIEHVGLRPNVDVPEPNGIEPSDNPAQDPQLKAAVGVLERMVRQTKSKPG